MALGGVTRKDRVRLLAYVLLTGLLETLRENSKAIVRHGWKVNPRSKVGEQDAVLMREAFEYAAGLLGEWIAREWVDRPKPSDSNGSSPSPFTS